MSRFCRSVLAAGLACSWVIAAFAAPVRNAPRITRIARSEEIKSPATVGLDAPNMPKFMDRYRDTTVTEAYTVYWNALAGVPPGTLITFEYRQGGSKKIRFLFHKFERPVRGEQKTVFRIPGGKRADAWRVRIVYGGRRIAERRSSNWRK